jgi:prepilin-type N-terminal cleavage/methylation domain-containing protein
MGNQKQKSIVPVYPPALFAGQNISGRNNVAANGVGIKNKSLESGTGFTLVELLVVISVIGLLASVMLVALNDTRSKAREAKLQADFTQLGKQVDIARDKADKALVFITQNGCSLCEFNFTIPANNQPAALAVNALSWQRIGLASAPKDPWGTPYAFDENEYEFGADPCRYDTISSSGPDGIFNTSDDRHVRLTNFICPD